MTVIRFAESTLTPQDFCDQFTVLFKKLFPHSAVGAKVTKNLGTSIYISFTLGKDKSEYSNGILQNDPMLHGIWVYGLTPEGDAFKSIVELSPSQGGLAVKYRPDPKDRFPMSMTHLKTGLRKKSGTAEDCLKALLQWLPKLRDLVRANADDVLTRDLYDVRSKI